MSKPRLTAAALVAFAAALLAACAPQVREPVPTEAKVPADFPAAYYEQLAAQGKAVYRIDAAQSLVVIEVRRAGSLARLGHDHVVASHDIGGYLAPEEGRADFYVPLSRLAVDEPALRSAAGFSTQPSESDIDGTRGNMLEKVLEAEKFPFAAVSASGALARTGEVEATIALHGTSRTLRVPLQLESGADEIRVSGRLALEQTDFGIVPYSLLGGAIAVQNRVDLRFAIRARRVP